MNEMVMGFATRDWSGYRDCIASWQPHPFNVVVAHDMDVLEAYQDIYQTTREPILGLPHDDVMCYEEGWWERVLREFADPGVGVVGFAGGVGHGTADLYVSPYHLPNLARQTFLSNMRDAERHGGRFAGERDVAILDGLALFVRRPIVDKWGGWPVDKPYGYWLYSEALCCEARRQGYRIRLVGVDCLHLGGKSSGHIAASPTYEEAHRYLWENNRDMLPYRVKE